MLLHRAQPKSAFCLQVGVWGSAKFLRRPRQSRLHRRL